jgi:rubrerythrin
MQEPQQTTSSNSYYNLVSALYHALQEAQTSAAYIRDAEQKGQQELVQFFHQQQQQANQRAQEVQRLLDQLRSSQSSRTTDQMMISEQGQYGLES